ncbi:methyltransferase domain-containing protein [Embleya sp. AB8]|uniref:methyltransferase domain-containing protein n=1 Tax=Embleya sp. AB8 TaxID=3156304 RepID=UPI003C70BAE1
MNDKHAAARLRTTLVERLRLIGSVRTEAVAHAMSEVPRELFTPGSTSLTEAYRDRVVVLSVDERGLPDSTVSQPAMVALMLEQLAVRPGMRVLEIGTGSGYNAALLATLVGPTGEVVSIEVSAELAGAAARRLAGLGVRVDVRAGDGWEGVADRAPFDRIEATVGVPDLPPAWVEQLAPDGVLVTPMWLRPGLELAIAWERAPDGTLTSVSVTRCGFLQLRGPHAGPGRTHALTGDLAVIGEDLPPAALDVLRELLDHGAVDAGPVLGPVDTRLTGFALAEPRSVLFLGHPGDGTTWGLFDPKLPALAVLMRDRILVYGDRDAAVELYYGVAGAPVVNAERLRVEAVPVGTNFPAAPASAGRSWTVERDHHHYRLTEI